MSRWNKKLLLQELFLSYVNVAYLNISSPDSEH
jgi:hypothetical protein